MSLTSVKMSEEVWLTCLTHALSTETEEIMGLLLGDIQQSRNGTTAVIWAALPQPRSDRQKDRVETNPEQLTAASLQAERMTKATNINTRVIGWYHSHPHITVLPSHVDVRTQAMYQLLDSGFIGLIFSCFSEDAQKVGRIQVIAFQSLDGKQNNHILRPLAISVPKGAVIDLDTSSSENALVKYGFHDQDTGDSRLKSSSKGGAKSLEMDGFYNHSNARSGEIYPNNAIVDIDNMDMSESMQEAMHRSNLEMSGAEYNRKEIPLYLMPTQTLLDFESPLGSFADLQRVLYEEEKTAFNQAIIQNTREGKLHPLMYIHHTSTYQASMCKLMEFCLSPAIDALQDRLRENEIQLKMLDDERKVLESEVVRGESSTVSPRSSSMQSHSPRGSGGSFNHREKDVYAPSNIGNSSGSRSRRSS